MQINNKTIITLSTILVIVLSNCSERFIDNPPRNAAENVVQFPLLNGNDFIFKVNRFSNHPDIQFPHDELQENHYSKTNDDVQYVIHFSDDGQVISIKPETIVGHKIKDSDDLKVYDLQEGLFAVNIFKLHDRKQKN